MSFLDRIAACNQFDPSEFRALVVEGVQVGWVRHALARRLARFADVFAVGDDVRLAPHLADFNRRTAAMDRVVRALEVEGVVSGRRDEFYPVAPAYAAPPLFQIERAAVPHFGIRSTGVHMNGFVRRADGIHLWIGRRAYDKPTYPGMLDNMVAGGQPIGISLADNLVKEAHEEAGIPAALSRRAISVGIVSYCLATPEGLKPDVMYCYDLELPADFVPVNTDGEIDEFMLWPAAHVAAIVRETTEFKFNCNLVIIDFLMRHGLIAPDDPDYVAIARGLRR